MQSMGGIVEIPDSLKFGVHGRAAVALFSQLNVGLFIPSLFA